MSDNKDNPFDPPQPERFEPPAPAEPAPMQPYGAPSPFEPSPFETAPFEPSPLERAPFEPAPFELTPFEPPPPRDSRLHYGTAPVTAAAADPLLPPVEPLLPPVEPLLPIDATVTAVPPEARLALDGTSLWLNRLGEELVAWLKTLASAAVYATLIVTFGFQVARVEGMSMAPTLQDQDRLIVNKLAYRLGDPQVGDIVMLYYPLKPDKSFVKRIIAEEGDQLRIVDGRVFRNDVPLDDSFVPPEYRSHDDWGPEVVPEGYYFVMGDHRNNSSDSRHWRYVPKKYIIGKVQLRWWPMGHAKVF